MEQDNCNLTALVCKMRSLGRWRLAVQQARFQGQLGRAEKVSFRGRRARRRGWRRGGLGRLTSLAAAAVLLLWGRTNHLKGSDSWEVFLGMGDVRTSDEMRKSQKQMNGKEVNERANQRG